MTKFEQVILILLVCIAKAVVQQPWSSRLCEAMSEAESIISRTGGREE